jgi:magnesium transporter
MEIIEYKGLKWIDIFTPTDDEMKILEKDYDFHPLIIEELKTPTFHPILESYQDYIFTILHFPNLDSESERVESIEIDFLVTKDTLITIRHQKFKDFDDVRFAIFGKPEQFMQNSSGHLFYHIVKKLISKRFPELNRFGQSIDRIESEIFEDFNEDIIEKIAIIKRQMIDFIKTVKPQKAIWDSIDDVGIKFWGEELRPYLVDIQTDYNRTLHFAETHNETVDSLHLTSSSLLDNKRNYVIKVLTIFTAIILPLSLIASIYGMNIALPLADNPGAFWWFLIGMATVIAAMLLFFHKRKWL